MLSSMKHDSINENISYIDAKTAQAIDESLMRPYQQMDSKSLSENSVNILNINKNFNRGCFSLDQLMELAGYTCACCILDYIQLQECNIKANFSVLVLCGPGNNGGDGLVVSRHLKHFGLNPTIVIPKTNFHSLLQQCIDLDIPIWDSLTLNIDSYDLVVDALFGFSYRGPSREPYSSIMEKMKVINHKLISIDIPSGWDVERGDIFDTELMPRCVISLTVPKLCMKGFQGIHYVGGRFVPPSIAEQFKITLPCYGINDKQYMRLK